MVVQGNLLMQFRVSPEIAILTFQLVIPEIIGGTEMGS